MRAATGSQWRSMSSGVTCALFGSLNTRCTAAFWIICSGFTTHAGRPVSRRELTKVCISSWVAYWVRYSLILQMLNSVNRHDRETEAMCSVNVSCSSIMTEISCCFGRNTRQGVNIDADVVVDGLFGWKDHQFRFGQVQLKVVVF